MVDIAADLERSGKTMRAIMRSAKLLKLEGKSHEASALMDRVVMETPVCLRSERWFDEALANCSCFEAMLQQTKRNRIYILGCGRSGTGYALGLMSTFAGSYIAAEERHYGHFAEIRLRSEPVHVVKRLHYSWKFADDTPRGINLLYILRDPRDVLTSEHIGTPGYINIDRWVSEMSALKRLINNERPGLNVIKFEDMAQRPEITQARIGQQLGLAVARPAHSFTDGLVVDEKMAAAMHGLRPPDPSVVGRWKRTSSSRDLIATLIPTIKEHFAPLEQMFGYDLHS